VMEVRLRVNGAESIVAAHPLARLLDVLREGLGLTGAKEGCGEGECGACTVLMDGLPVLACLVPVCQAQGKEITTIEGLAGNDELHPLQRAFQEEGAAQCGICTPGMILAAAYYLEHREAADDIAEALAGNQCRCTGYWPIIDAVRKAWRASGASTE